MRRFLWLVIVVLLALAACGPGRTTVADADAPAADSPTSDVGEASDAAEASDVQNDDTTGTQASTRDANAAEEPGTVVIIDPAPVLQILADGVVQAGLPELPLSFDVSGKVLTVRVRSGDTVRVGDVIATVDDADIREQLTQAELNLRTARLSLRTVANPGDWDSEAERRVAAASLESTRASLSSAQAGLASAVASRDFAARNLADLSNSDVIAEANLQSARASLASAQAQLAALEAGADADSVRQAELNLEQAQNGLESAELDREVSLLPTSPESVRQQLDASVENAQISVELAEISLRRTTSGATSSELASGRASVAAAEAQLASARESLADVDDAIAQAQASLVQAEASVVQAESGLLQAEANLATVLAGGSARELAAAEINVAQSELALSQAQRNLDGTVLRSPVSGAVLSVHVSPGSSIGAGSPAVTLLNTGTLEFHTTNVTERDLSEIREGQRAQVTLKTYPGVVLDGVVTRIGLQAGEPVGDSATFPVVLELSADGLMIVPGMTGRAEIELDG